MSDQQPYSPSGMPLPQPNFPVGQPGPVQAPQAFRAPEVTPIRIAPLPPASQTMPLPQPAMPQHLQQSGVPSATPAVGADEDDSQLDEVWINKAREVVDSTRYDPYVQSSELSKIKAGYLKSRYNKDIKTIEDRSQ